MCETQSILACFLYRFLVGAGLKQVGETLLFLCFATSMKSCFSKLLIARVQMILKLCGFSETEVDVYSRFLPIGQVEMSLRENDQVLLMFASQRMENKCDG